MVRQEHGSVTVSDGSWRGGGVGTMAVVNQPLEQGGDQGLDEGFVPEVCQIVAGREG